MAIRLPKTWLGEPVHGSIEQVLKGKPTPEVEPTGQTPPVFQQPQGIVDPSTYLILPARSHGQYNYPQIYVAMEKSYFNKDWNQAHEELRREEAFMLNPRQFVDFLGLLKSGNVYDGSNQKVPESRLTEILNEIVEVRSGSWRSEWLDAKFSEVALLRKMIVVPQSEMHITYHKFDNAGNLKEVTEPLEPYASSDAQIDFDDFLNNATVHGLPKPGATNGKLSYWAPVGDPVGVRVARFSASSDWAYLGCVVVPTGSGSQLGVRAARAKI